MIDGQILKSVGEMLFGYFWRRDFETRFNISNRSLRRMLANQQDIPAGLARDMEIAIRDHGHKLDALLETLVDMQDSAS